MRGWPCVSGADMRQVAAHLGRRGTGGGHAATSLPGRSNQFDDYLIADGRTPQWKREDGLENTVSVQWTD